MIVLLLAAMFAVVIGLTVKLITQQAQIKAKLDVVSERADEAAKTAKKVKKTVDSWELEPNEESPEKGVKGKPKGA